MTPKITNGGIGLMVRALTGEGITFSKIAIGNGDCPEDYLTLEGLVNQVAEIELDSIEKQNSYVELKGTLKNSSLTAGFNWSEIGVFCKDPDGGDTDILYAYRHCQIVDDEEETGTTYIPRFGSDIVELTISIYVYVGEIEDVSAALAESSEYATAAALQGHMEDNQNPHGVTAEQVGLGNVPNVATNDQTPTYTAASSLSELASGETLETAFGKLALAVKKLISHLKDTTMHITAAERTAWNSKAASSHNHSAANITSGTLSVARGGTGATSAEAAAHSLGALYSGRVGNSYKITSGKNLNSYTTGGTYWCNSGTTASGLKNCPYKSSNFLLLVLNPASNEIFQLLLPLSTSTSIALYMRAYNTDGWGVWRKTDTSGV